MPKREEDQLGGAAAKWAMRLLNIVLGVAGLVAVVVGLRFLIEGQGTLAVSGISCGTVLLLLATVDRFEVIKGIGIEAKTRDLSREIDNAEHILAQIKEITVAFAPSLVRLAANAGRLSGAQPPDLVYQLARSTDRLMTAAGADRHAVRESLAPWAQMAAWDVTDWVMRTTDADFQAELTCSNQMAHPQHGQPYDPHEPPFVQALAHFQQVQEWGAVVRKISTWTPAECAFQLRARASSLPSYISDGSAKTFNDRVETWAPELEHLSKYDDFRDSDQWIKRLKSIHAEAAGLKQDED